MTLPDSLPDPLAGSAALPASADPAVSAGDADAAKAHACCGAPADDLAADDARRVRQPDKAQLLNRLRRIEGQVRGVTRMVEEDRYCLDLLTQIAALRAALSGISMQLLENHVHGCVAQALREDDGTAAVDELMQVLRRLDGKAFGG